jgi:WS/DGAT/MGAT family acyltransferase
VVLAAITGGFRDLLQGRGELSSEKLVVRSMVPVSVRKADQKGSLNNQVSAVFVDLPVGLPDPVARLQAIRGQMDEYKKTMSAIDANSIIDMGNYVAPTLLALGVRAALSAGQFMVQAVTTNVPGPRFPLYVLGKKMVSAYAYVPIAGGTRCSIGIFSYQNTMTFGLNADFDGYPDIDTLSGGIRRALDELLTLAKQHTDKAAAQPKGAAAQTAPAKTAPAKRTAAKATPAKSAAPKKKTAAAAQQ